MNNTFKLSEEKREKPRLQALRLSICFNMPNEQISQIVFLSVTYIKRLVSLYENKGLPSILCKKQGGNHAQDGEPIIKDQTITLFPIGVEEKVENDYGVIIRTYALKPDEKPSDIPINSFEKYGIRYELSEIIKKENRSEDKLAHSETITINTPTNDMTVQYLQALLRGLRQTHGYKQRNMQLM